MTNVADSDEYIVTKVVDETTLWLDREAENSEAADAYTMEDKRDPNTLYYTPPDAPDDVPLLYTLPIGQGDGDEITALWAAKEALFVFKHSSIWVVEGYSPDTWSVRQLTTGIGCDSQSSMRVVNLDGGEFVREALQAPALAALGSAIPAPNSAIATARSSTFAAGRGPPGA